MGGDSIDAIAPLLSKYFDMEWTETDPAGFGSRAVVGKHRVKLVEKPDPALSDHFMQSLIAAEMIFDDPESVWARIEAAGFPVLWERTFSSGRKACYFGNPLAGLPPIGRASCRESVVQYV